MRLHGTTRTAVSDRDKTFMSHFWKVLWKKLEINLLYSTSCHPQMDVLAKVYNRTIGQLLKAILKKDLGKREQCFPFIGFSYKRACHSITTFSPFDAVYDFNPFRFDLFAY